MDRFTKPKFRFVNLTHYDDLKDEETQRRIRGIVMADVGRARRKPNARRERIEIVYEIRDPTEACFDFERLGGGQMDPFCRYPVEVTGSERALIANIFDPKSNHPIRMRDYWYPVGLSCPAMFYGVLSMSQSFALQNLNEHLTLQDDTLSLTHSYKALRAANEMMKDSSLYKSDEMIGTVASFMCHHTLLKSSADGYWYKHRNALVHLVGLRGGYEGIRNEHLQITLTWADLLGSFSQDIPPVVPLPARWENNCRALLNSPRPYSPISTIWKKQLPMQQDWISVFDDVMHFITLDPAFNTERPLLSVTDSSWLEATAYRLLCVRPLQRGKERGNVIEEVCRLGTLLFLTPIWGLLGRYTFRTAVISRKLLLTLTENMVEWNDLKPLVVWVLYFAAIETSDLEERAHYVVMLAFFVRDTYLQDWNEVMRMIKDVLWVEEVYAGSDEIVRDDVMQIVNQDYIGTQSQSVLRQHDWKG